jgi:hypothetical protein
VNAHVLKCRSITIFTSGWDTNPIVIRQVAQD